jgi:hypothetical protein
VFLLSAKRRNVVAPLPGFGLNRRRCVFVAHCLPRFSKAFPPEKLALPLLAKPRFVTISLRHNSLLCERITPITLGPTVSRRFVDHLLTSPTSDGSQKLHIYTLDLYPWCDSRVSSVRLTHVVKSAHPNQ